MHKDRGLRTAGPILSRWALILHVWLCTLHTESRYLAGMAANRTRSRHKLKPNSDSKSLADFMLDSYSSGVISSLELEASGPRTREDITMGERLYHHFHRHYSAGDVRCICYLANYTQQRHS